jgi:hypothetical protein
MFGFGIWELIIVAIICLMIAVPGVIGLGVIIWLILKQRSSGESTHAK